MTEPKKAPLFRALERRQIVAILALSTATLFAVCILLVYDPALGTILLSSIGLHAVGARAPAILYGLVSGLSPMTTLFFNFYIEVLIVILCYYSFVLIVREGIETKFLHLAAKRAELAAQKHRAAIKRYELVGLFFFVMAPFAMTGPVTGAIVGYLLNLRPWVTFAVVLSGTFCALAGYVMLGQTVLTYLISLQQEYQDIVTLVIAFLIAAFTIYHVRSIVGWVNESLED